MADKLSVIECGSWS